MQVRGEKILKVSTSGIANRQSIVDIDNRCSLKMHSTSSDVNI